MKYYCREQGFHFEMNNPNFVSLNDKGKAAIFKMNEQQIKQTPYAFAETKDDKFTGRAFTMTLDGGRYPTKEDEDKGFALCVENVKKYTPFKVLSQSSIMPGNIMHVVLQGPNGMLLSQYYMVKNSYMFCLAGAISAEHDDLDDLMASVCISVRGENAQDKQRERQEEMMKEYSSEVNRLIAQGMSMDKAVAKAREKFGIK